MTRPPPALRRLRAAALLAGAWALCVQLLAFAALMPAMGGTLGLGGAWVTICSGGELTRTVIPDEGAPAGSDIHDHCPLCTLAAGTAPPPSGPDLPAPLPQPGRGGPPVASLAAPSLWLLTGLQARAPPAHA